VVIFPGFLSSAPAYTTVAQHLQELGYATSKSLTAASTVLVSLYVVMVALGIAGIVPIKSKDWGPALAGGDFVWYLDKAQRTIQDASSRAGGQAVALAAFSAGGFLARLLMGTAPYAGTCGGRHDRRRFAR
jgi:alpha-beta hydrolase superfamily lysophospholipase